MDSIEKILNNWKEKSDWLFHDESGNCSEKKSSVEKWNGLCAAIRNSNHTAAPVIICLPHNQNFFLSILACLQEKVPFVPTLPSWPASRFEQLQEFVSPALVINEKNFDALTTTKTSFKETANSNTAYIMFTSGTTGKPKGVCIPRAALGSFWNWLDSYFTHVPKKTNQLLVTQFTFDISLLDVGLFLLKNTNLYFSNFNGNAFALGAELEEWKIEFINTVPNNINSFVQAGMHTRCDLSTLKNVLIGGAKFSTATYLGVCGEWSKNARVYNFYGPTEATIYTHVHELTKKTEKDCLDKNVTVGKPTTGVLHAIKNTTGTELVAKGKVGEILLGGSQLMEGYLKDPTTTEKALIEFEGKRYYRTGDLGLIDSEGRLFVVGRLDETIKRRGFRVNLLDIDAYVQKLDTVMDCMTLAYPDENLENWLLLVVIGKSPSEKKKLQEDLRGLLLEHQLPDEIVFTDKFPVNSSGKVDRKALMSQFADLHLR